MAGEPKYTLPTTSRFAIYMMRVRDRLTYREISLRTGVKQSMVEAICKRPGRLIDSGREVSPALPADLCATANDLVKKIEKLHAAVCGDRPIRLRIPMSES